MKNKLAYGLITASFIATPLVTFAAARTLSDLVIKITGYLNQALVLMMGLAVIIFIWNVIRYFIMSTEDHKEAAPYVMWSVIGFFVILSFWGLVNILQGTFGLQNSANRPGSWSEFSNLFPSSGSGSSGGSSNSVFTTSGQTNSGFTTSGQPGTGFTGSGQSNVPSYLPTPTWDSFNAKQR